MISHGNISANVTHTVVPHKANQDQTEMVITPLAASRFHVYLYTTRQRHQEFL